MKLQREVHRQSEETLGPWDTYIKGQEDKYCFLYPSVTGSDIERNMQMQLVNPWHRQSRGI